VGLDEYKRKRDFRVTGEPSGRVGPSATGHSFVIQKHAASRLHYDFRLELDGVLKSWSVPKGPSCDPLVKRLAISVEDHPIDYGGFEGVIPAGQYGGGTVLLWDRGTWSPLSDPAKALAAGELKFELSGEKLKGRWVLVKIKERASGRNAHKGPPGRTWLLIKERDSLARPESEWNVTEAQPGSVATGRDLGQIANASDRVWHSTRDRPDPSRLSGARPTEMPEVVRPARPIHTRAVPDTDGWVHEVEIRGLRVICRINAGSAELVDEQGQSLPRALPTLRRALLSLPVHDAVLDGMATALGPGGETRDDRPADTLYLFDVIHLDGYDLTRVALSDRKTLLQSVIKAGGIISGLRYVDHVIGRGTQTFEAAGALGAPGLVSKRADGVYRHGPSPTRDWRVVACLRPPVGAVAAQDSQPAASGHGGRPGMAAGGDKVTGGRKTARRGGKKTSAAKTAGRTTNTAGGKTPGRAKKTTGGEPGGA
jgi:bifunctional non-homologous end joining protein LigD